MHALLGALVASAVSHAAVTFPRPRQSMDRGLQIGQGGCNSSLAPSATTKKTGSGNGQACYWFNNGCDFGCATCDGTNSSTGHDDETYKKYVYKGKTKAQLAANNMTASTLAGLWAPKPGDMTIDAKAYPTGGPSGGPAPYPLIKSNCGKRGKPTICDPKLRTLNVDAECGSDADIYQLSPWRAPGTAPIMDSCGSAGGRHPGQGNGTALADFTDFTLDGVRVFQGMKGSTLPQMPPQATWKAGAAVEVGWSLRAQHGGGYSYRLAPAAGPLTEQTFCQGHLYFVGNASLRWDGDKSTDLPFSPVARGWQTTKGTFPAGSMWRKVPIPRGIGQWDESGASFEPVCDESAECRKQALGKSYAQGCRCSGQPQNLEIVDRVLIPASTKPGRYVLGWRWDTEEGGQVWNSCSDVEVIA